MLRLLSMNYALIYHQGIKVSEIKRIFPIMGFAYKTLME